MPSSPWRLVALLCVIALIALGLAWELVLAPTGAKSLALKVLPLAATLRGLSAGRARTFRVMSLLVWLYAAEGALRVASDRGLSAQLAGVELVLALGLFAACALHLRHPSVTGAATRGDAAPKTTPKATSKAGP
jgi:uncharacterized membrane protein